jgi:hypothetical protein
VLELDDSVIDGAEVHVVIDCREMAGASCARLQSSVRTDDRCADSFTELG